MTPRAVLLAALAACAAPRPDAEIVRDLKAGPPRRLLAEVARDQTAPARWLGEPRAAALPFLRGAVPAVTALVNGVPVPMLVDTGASGVVLSPRAARAVGAHVTPHPPVEALSPGFAVRLHSGAVERLELGGAAFGPLAVAVPDGAFLRGRMLPSRDGVFGVLGCSVLSRFRATFDLRRGELRLVPGPEEAPAAPPFVRVEVNGVSLPLLFDTGARGIFLEPRAARDLRLIAAGDVARLERKAESIGGASYPRVRLDTVAVGGRAWRDMPAHVAHTFPDGLAAGLFGIMSFEPLAWTVDFASGDLYVAD